MQTSAETMGRIRLIASKLARGPSYTLNIIPLKEIGK